MPTDLSLSRALEGGGALYVAAYTGLGDAIILGPILRELSVRHPGRVFYPDNPILAFYRRAEVPGLCDLRPVDPRLRRIAAPLAPELTDFIAENRIAAVLSFRRDALSGGEAYARGAAELRARGVHVTDVCTSTPAESQRRKHVLDLACDYLAAVGVPIPKPRAGWLAAAAPSLVGTASAAAGRTLLYPGAGQPHKRLAPRFWADVVSRLGCGDDGLAIISGLSEAERREAGALSTLLSSAGMAHELIASWTLMDLAALLAGCRVVVSCDTFVVHLATALGAPVVGVYPATSAVMYGPYGDRSTTGAVQSAYHASCPRSNALGNCDAWEVGCADTPCHAGIAPGAVAAEVQRVVHAAAAPRQEPKRPYLYLDLGFYAACNLKCTYCRNELVKDDGAFSMRRLLDEVDAFRERFRAAVVKLSGYGEVTLWKDFKPSLAELSQRFPSVQVISNGTFSDETRRAMLAHEEVSPNITIDGHLLGMNRLRVGASGKLHARILENLRAFVDAGRPLEVNCVLHEHNADGLEAFCEHLHELDAGRGLLMFFPFPVKPFDRERQAAIPLRAGLRRVAARIPALWRAHAEILPAARYGENLASVLERGFRAGDCHVHWANLGSGSRDERLHCSNYGEDLSYGPMPDALSGRAEAIAREETMHLRLGHVGPNCAHCYNHFHIINDYLEGTISLAELCRVPSLRPPGVAPIARALKETFDRARAAAGPTTQSLRLP